VNCESSHSVIKMQGSLSCMHYCIYIAIKQYYTLFYHHDHMFVVSIGRENGELDWDTLGKILTASMLEEVSIIQWFNMAINLECLV